MTRAHKIMDILTALITAPAVNMLYHAYRAPSITPSGLTKVVLYDTGRADNRLVSVTLAGACYAGDMKMACGDLQLGEGVVWVPPIGRRF